MIDEVAHPADYVAITASAYAETGIVECERCGWWRRANTEYLDGMADQHYLWHRRQIDGSPTTSQVASHGGDSPQRGIGGQGRAGTSPAAHRDGPEPVGMVPPADPGQPTQYDGAVAP